MSNEHDTAKMQLLVDQVFEGNLAADGVLGKPTFICSAVPNLRRARFGLPRLSAIPLVLDPSNLIWGKFG